jgi:hypothetical protein
MNPPGTSLRLPLALRVAAASAALAWAFSCSSDFTSDFVSSPGGGEATPREPQSTDDPPSEPAPDASPEPQARRPGVATVDGKGTRAKALAPSADVKGAKAAGPGTDVATTTPTPEPPGLDTVPHVEDIPGVPVVRVGVNFEDLGFSGDNDRDYNDAVLCFSGHFKVDGTNVVSIADQTVMGTTSSISGCHHRIKVTIVAPDGTSSAPIVYDSRRTQPVPLPFTIGSRLEVTMTPYDKCNPGVERTMHQPQHARVAPDVCNTTGR